MKNLRCGALALVLIAIGGCGPEDGGDIAADVALAQGLAVSDLNSFDLFVMTNKGFDGSAFSCATLAGDLIYRHVQEAEIVYDTPPNKPLLPGATKVTGIAKGTGLVVVLVGYGTADALGDPIAQGCLDGVTIAGGQTKTISITLSPLK